MNLIKYFSKLCLVLFVSLFFSCSKKIDDKNQLYKKGVVYYNTPETKFESKENADLFEESKVLHYNHDYKGCLEILLRLEKEEPLNKLILGSLGIVYLSLEQYDKSEMYLVKVTDLYPEFFNNWINLSRLYISTKKYDLAHETLLGIETLEKTDEEEFFYLFQLASLNYNIGKCEKALLFCESMMYLNVDELYIANVKQLYDDIKKDCVEK